MLGLHARAIALKLDDDVHFGFSAGARIEVFTNLQRLSISEPYLAQGFEGGDEYAHVRTDWELRMSRNDMFSTAGLPFPDVMAFGIF